MSQNFGFYNTVFKRVGTGNWVVARGDIVNNSAKDYNTALFRIAVFDKKLLLWTGPVKIMGFKKGQSRSFELFMEGLDHRALPSISRHEMYFESGY